MPRREETRPVRLELAAPEDAGPLTVIAAVAFFDDRKWMPAEIREERLSPEDPSKGPPLTSFDWNLEAIRNVNGESSKTQSAYYKVLLGESKVVGGFVAVERRDFGEGEWWCGGIYVDPDYQGRGIGKEIFRQVFRRHPNAKRWTLETPVWATRNHHFYEKMGFSHFGTCDIEPPEEFQFRQYENTLSQEERLKL